jgi:hypothetical protein
MITIRAGDKDESAVVASLSALAVDKLIAGDMTALGFANEAGPSLRERAMVALNLGMFQNVNAPEEVGLVVLDPQLPRQYILRMMVMRDGDPMQVPSELSWLSPMITMAEKNQASIGVRQPFCYITVRHGEVTSEQDDEWHTDGFSTRITHLPEQNYIYANTSPTEWARQGFYIPSDFNPLVHNLHRYLAARVQEENIRTAVPRMVYAIDPYVLHRRPPVTAGITRTFVRISFTPIEILDDAHTPNPLLPCRTYGKDGVSIRNKLKEY